VRINGTYAEESGLFDTFIRTDPQLLTKKKLEGNAENLGRFNVVLFCTTGELETDESQRADL